MTIISEVSGYYDDINVAVLWDVVRYSLAASDRSFRVLTASIASNYNYNYHFEFNKFETCFWGPRLDLISHEPGYPNFRLKLQKFYELLLMLYEHYLIKKWKLYFLYFSHDYTNSLLINTLKPSGNSYVSHALTNSTSAFLWESVIAGFIRLSE